MKTDAKAKRRKRRGKNNGDNASKTEAVRELVNNLQVLHDWQGVLLCELARRAEVVSSGDKNVGGEIRAGRQGADKMDA